MSQESPYDDHNRQCVRSERRASVTPDVKQVRRQGHGRYTTQSKATALTRCENQREIAAEAMPRAASSGSARARGPGADRRGHGPLRVPSTARQVECTHGGIIHTAGDGTLDGHGRRLTLHNKLMARICAVLDPRQRHGPRSPKETESTSLQKAHAKWSPWAGEEWPRTHQRVVRMTPRAMLEAPPKMQITASRGG